MRMSVAVLAAASLLLPAAAARAQARPAQVRAPKEHARVMVNVGLQATPTTVTQTLTFQQYVEQGSLTLERTVPRTLFYDGGAAISVMGALHLGATISLFKNAGSGNVTAAVPNPLFFNKLRATTGTVSGVTRRETATHIQASWTAPAAGGIEFTAFGGPTIFQTEQTFVSQLNLTLANEVYPYDSLSFPGVNTETVTQRVFGINAGVDMTWRFGKNIGAGILIRYSHGSTDVTPPGGQATKIEVGGLHAGGGLRLIF